MLNKLTKIAIFIFLILISILTFIFVLMVARQIDSEYDTTIKKTPLKATSREISPISINATVYSYNNEISQTDSNPDFMASGKKVFSGAIANNCLPFGTEVAIKTQEIDKLEVYRVFEVQDRMAKKYGCEIFDIFSFDKKWSKNWGKQQKEVLIFNNK